MLYLKIFRDFTYSYLLSSNWLSGSISKSSRINNILEPVLLESSIMICIRTDLGLIYSTRILNLTIRKNENINANT